MPKIRHVSREIPHSGLDFFAVSGSNERFAGI